RGGVAVLRHRRRGRWLPICSRPDLLLCLGGRWHEASNHSGRLTSYRGGRLTGADLSGAHLNGTFLRDADLSGANLSGAIVYTSLSGTKGLTQQQLDKACGEGVTVDPPLTFTDKPCPQPP